MALFNSSETLTVRGTLDISSGTLTAKSGQINRSYLQQQDDSEIGIPLNQVVVWDAPNTSLSGTAGADDLALVDGGFGTAGVTIQTSDAKAASGVTQYGRVFVPVGNDFVLTETMTIRLQAGMNTTIADQSATLDLEVYVADADGDIGSDLCSTAAQSINSLTLAAKDFSITTSSIAHGDILDCRITLYANDYATGTAVIGEVSNMKLLRDIKG